MDNVELSKKIDSPMDAFVLRCNVLSMKADETKNERATMLTEQITDKVASTITDVIQVWCTSTKDRIESPIFHLAEKSLIIAVPRGRSESLLVRNVNKIAEPDRSLMP